MAKAVTKYQEHRGSELEYTRPFLTPFDGWRAVKNLLSDEETGIDDKAVEGIENFLEEDEE